uniref:Uncharacterized protein n=1 Tax=Triticum urartu TaxID=4572 RepID=A0A8R7VDR7_TRIUA
MPLVLQCYLSQNFVAIPVLSFCNCSVKYPRIAV